jgi:hypothetical protein
MLSKSILALIGVAIVASPVLAKNVGQIPSDIPDSTRSWFKTVRSPGGVPCCDIADGHLESHWRAVTPVGDNSSYEIPIIDDGGQTDWVPIPTDKIIYSAGNPMDDAIAWYVDQGNPTTEEGGRRLHHYYIRCFVPPGGA